MRIFSLASLPLNLGFLPFLQASLTLDICPFCPNLQYVFRVPHCNSWFSYKFKTPFHPALAYSGYAQGSYNFLSRRSSGYFQKQSKKSPRKGLGHSYMKQKEKHYIFSVIFFLPTFSPYQCALIKSSILYLYTSQKF